MFNSTEKTFVLDALPHYLIAALWTSELDDLTIENFTEYAKEQATHELTLFYSEVHALEGFANVDTEQFGHDFWLTRCGHGAGFWSRGLGELGDKLTEICRDLPDRLVFVNDDGLAEFA